MKIIKHTFIFLLILHNSVLFSQNDSILNNYIDYALKNNLALKQKIENYNKSIVILKQARALFFPQLSLNARYSRAEGGRTIDIPIGDMMNPVYDNLNGINDFMYAAGLIDEPEKYPHIDNQSIAFLRPHEQETKARLIQPLINNQIWYNNKIKKDLSEIESQNINSYRNELIAEVKIAYYKYLQTLELLKIISQTKILINENINLNQKLYDNDKVTYDKVLRAKTELSKINQKQSEFNKLNTTAKAYFNFLLNRDLNSDIKIEQPNIKINSLNNVDVFIDSALNNRSELKIINLYKAANKNNIKLNKTNTLPNIYGVLDYGFQGENYTFNKNHDFYIASLVLKWDLFKGLENYNKIQESKITESILNDKLEETQKKINLQILNSYYDVKSAEKNITLAKDQQKLANENFKIINKKHKIGTANQLEYIDARTQLTNAQINYSLIKYDYLIKLTQLYKNINFFK